MTTDSKKEFEKMFTDNSKYTDNMTIVSEEKYDFTIPKVYAKLQNDVIEKVRELLEEQNLSKSENHRVFAVVADRPYDIGNFQNVYRYCSSWMTAETVESAAYIIRDTIMMGLHADRRYDPDI